MTRRLLLADLAVAVAGALVVLILAPGVAVVGILALIVIAGCVASVMIGRVRASRTQKRASTQRRQRPREPREPRAR